MRHRRAARSKYMITLTLLTHCANIYFKAIRSPLCFFCFCTDNRCVLNVFYARLLNTDEGMHPGVRLNRVPPHRMQCRFPGILYSVVPRVVFEECRFLLKFQWHSLLALAEVNHRFSHYIWRSALMHRLRCKILPTVLEIGKHDIRLITVVWYKLWVTVLQPTDYRHNADGVDVVL